MYQNVTGNSNTMNTQRAVLDYRAPLDHQRMMEYIDIMIDRYPQLSCNYIGESILGRGIPILSIGEGEKEVLYIGGQRGTDWMTSVILLRFINECCELLKGSGKVFNHNLKYLFSARKISVVPMLDPDGIDYQINGISKDNVLYDRVISSNGGSRDLSEWTGNARGVELCENYNFEFVKRVSTCREGIQKNIGEMPESEPETGALCNYIRYDDHIKIALDLYMFGEEICLCDGAVADGCMKNTLRILSQSCGYVSGGKEESLKYGSFGAWCAEELNIPSLTVSCGRGKQVLPVQAYFCIYARVRELLFKLPSMI